MRSCNAVSLLGLEADYLNMEGTDKLSSECLELLFIVWVWCVAIVYGLSFCTVRIECQMGFGYSLLISSRTLWPGGRQVAQAVPRGTFFSCESGLVTQPSVL